MDAPVEKMCLPDRSGEIVDHVLQPGDPIDTERIESIIDLMKARRVLANKITELNDVTCPRPSPNYTWLWRRIEEERVNGTLHNSDLPLL